MEMTNLAKYGAVGISLALVWLIGFMVKQFITVITNHLQHTNDTMAGLRTAITELITYLKTQNGKRG